MKYLALVLKTYLKRVHRLKFLQLVVELSLLSFILKITLGIIISLTAKNFNLNLNAINFYTNNQDLTSLVLVVVIAAPIVETFVGQYLPITLASKFTNNTFLKISISVIFFSLFHQNFYIALAVFPINIILAWSFVIRSKHSNKAAFTATATIHALHNLLSLFVAQLKIGS